MEIIFLQKGYFNVLAVFLVWICLEEGELCKNNDPTCMFNCIKT